MQKMKTMMKMKMLTSGAPGNPPLSYFSRSYYVLNNSKETTRLEELIENRCNSGTLEVEEAMGLFRSMIQTRPIPGYSMV